jgi:hypothetical protein
MSALVHLFGFLSPRDRCVAALVAKVMNCQPFRYARFISMASPRWPRVGPNEHTQKSTLVQENSRDYMHGVANAAPVEV